jgi:hypothetical protein
LFALVAKRLGIRSYSAKTAILAYALKGMFCLTHLNFHQAVLVAVQVDRLMNAKTFLTWRAGPVEMFL